MWCIPLLACDHHDTVTWRTFRVPLPCTPDGSRPSEDLEDKYLCASTCGRMHSNMADCKYERRELMDDAPLIPVVLLL